MVKKERIEIRVTKIEKKILEKKALKAGLKLSEYVRQCCLDKEIKATISEEERSLLKLLYELGADFREMKKTASKEEIIAFELMIKTIRERLIDVYDR